MKKIMSAESLGFAGIFFLPLYLWRFSLFKIPTNVWELWVSASLIVVIFIPGYWCKILDLIKKEKMLLFFSGMILAGLIISTLAGKNISSGLGIIKGWFIFPVLFYMIAKITEIKSDYSRMFIAYHISSFIVAVIATGYYLLGIVTFDGRLQGFFNSPNYLAMYLAPGLIIGLEMLQNKLFLKKYIFISVLVISITLYMTFSYASWVALVISLGVMYWTKSKQETISIFRNKIIILTIISFLVFFSQYSNTKLSGLISSDPRSSLSSRMMIWKSAVRMLEGSWIFGIGPGNFQVRYLENQKYYQPYLEWAVPHPHNTILAFWLYSGLIGLIGFIGILILFFKRILSSQNKNPARFVALGIMTYILFHGLVDTTYFKNDLAVVFWLCFLGL